MRSRDELERLLLAQRPAPRGRGRVDLLVVRSEPGLHLTPERAELTPERGMVGDRWSQALPAVREVGRQLTLMMTHVAELVCDGQPLDLPGDNLLVSLDLGEHALPVGTRLRAGTALLEVSDKPHTGCKKFVARFGAAAMEWVNDEPGRARRLRGLNCLVIEPGQVAVGDPIAVASR